MSQPNLIAMGDAIAKQIKAERNATTDFVLNVKAFLADLEIDGLPDHMRNAKAILEKDCERYLSS